jgi:hypothetical protein
MHRVHRRHHSHLPNLVGVVATQMDKQIAGIRANGVPGVFPINNDLRVEES